MKCGKSNENDSVSFFKEIKFFSKIADVNLGLHYNKVLSLFLMVVVAFVLTIKYQLLVALKRAQEFLKMFLIHQSVKNFIRIKLHSLKLQ